MKKQYEQPAMQVTEMEEYSILETSPGGVIPPGEKNQPAGARRLDDDWDD